jgi:hypothetical protein
MWRDFGGGTIPSARKFWWLTCSVVCYPTLSYPGRQVRSEQPKRRTLASGGWRPANTWRRTLAVAINPTASSPQRAVRVGWAASTSHDSGNVSRVGLSLIWPHSTPQRDRHRHPAPEAQCAAHASQPAAAAPWGRHLQWCPVEQEHEGFQPHPTTAASGPDIFGQDFQTNLTSVGGWVDGTVVY